MYFNLLRVMRHPIYQRLLSLFGLYKKVLGKILLYTSIFVFIVIILLGTLLTVTYYNKDYITERILQTLFQNYGLSVEMKSVELSLFPILLSQNIVLDSVTLRYTEKKETVLQSESLKFSFSLLELLTKSQFTLKTITAKNGSIFITPKIIETFSPTDTVSDIALLFSNIVLDNITLNVRYPDFQFVAFLLDNQFVFKDGSINLIEARGKIKCQQLSVPKFQLKKVVNIEYDALLSRQRLILRQFNLLQEKIMLDCKNSAIDFSQEDFLISVKSPTVNIVTLEKIVAEYVDDLVLNNPLNVESGNIAFHVVGYGKFASPSELLCKVRCWGESVNVTDKKTEQQLHALNFDIGFGGNLKNGTLWFYKTDFNWKEIPVNINGKINYSQNPYLNVALSFKTPTDQVKTFGNIDFLNLAGQFEVKGFLSDVTQENFLNVSRSGNVTVSAITFKEEQITLRNTSAFFDDAILKGESFLESNFATGFLYTEIENFKLLQKPNEKSNLIINSKLNCDRLNIDILNATLQQFWKPTVGQGNNNSSPLYLTLDLACKQFTIKEKVGKSFIGELFVSPTLIRINNAKADFFDGILQTNLQVKNESYGFSISGTLNLQSIDVSQTFNFFENFNQKNLTGDEISGSLSGNITFSSRLNKNYDLDRESLWCLADIELKNGILHSSTIKKALSPYINEKLLSEIKFAALKNTILVNRQTITIPNMILQNNVFSTEFSGTQSFSGNFEYYALFNVSEVFQRNKNKDITQPLKNGGAKLGLTIKGNLDHYNIKLEQHIVKLPNLSGISNTVESIKQTLNEPVEIPTKQLQYQIDDDDFQENEDTSSSPRNIKIQPDRRSNIVDEWKDE